MSQPPNTSGGARITITSSLTDRWDRSDKGRHISVHAVPLIKKDTKIFCMGSCFAVEIRGALTAAGFDVYPKYRDIKFDPATQQLAKLPKRDNINHYNTFSIRHEFETAFNGTHCDFSDFWKIKEVLPDQRVAVTYQAPYRKQIYAATPEALKDLSDKIDDCLAAAIQQCDVYIITLGLTEIWFNKANGFPLGTPPRDGLVSPLARFHASSFQENYDNLKHICDLVFGRYPDRHVVFTVSPVRLGETYTGNDVVVANTESKSILRAAAAQIEREYANVHYWPSYEVAHATDVFAEDGRHVSDDGVNFIVTNFLKAYVTGP